MTPDLPTFAIGIVFGLMMGRPDLVLKLKEGIKKQREAFRNVKGIQSDKERR